MRIKSFILALILGCMSVFATISTARADEAFLTYTPSSGSINFSSSTANGREAKATFKWNIAGCSEFNASNDTYEQELVFYNYDGKAYATSMRSYRTNLPNHYRDTRFCDSQNEINLAVGTYSANSIIPNKEYYVTYRLGGGNSNRSKYKISVQEGVITSFRSQKLFSLNQRQSLYLSMLRSSDVGILRLNTMTPLSVRTAPA